MILYLIKKDSMLIIHRSKLAYTSYPTSKPISTFGKTHYPGQYMNSMNIIITSYKVEEIWCDVILLFHRIWYVLFWCSAPYYHGVKWLLGAFWVEYILKIHVRNWNSSLESKQFGIVIEVKGSNWFVYVGDIHRNGENGFQSNQEVMNEPAYENTHLSEMKMNQFWIYHIRK